MYRHLIIAALGMSLLCLVNGPSFAMMPVIDTAAIAQLIKQLDEMEREYTMLENQFNQLQAMNVSTQGILGEMQGNYGFGQWMNSDKDLIQREWSPASWDDALQGKSGNTPQEYEQLLHEYQQAHPSLSQSDYQKGGSDANYQTYQQNTQVNQAAMVQSTYEFNDINHHLQNIHDLSNQIETADNQKAATDLNSRLLAELANIQIEELKMITTLNQQVAQSQASELADENQTVQYNTIPNLP